MYGSKAACSTLTEGSNSRGKRRDISLISGFPTDVEMASSSSTGATPPAPSQSELSSLPIMSLRDKIVEKILQNRVTLIVGETGCGKSSQVPQFLLEERMEPILCTQPRRFAVVSVARMVAKFRNCEVGGEVGYHIGHSRVLSSSSKLVFKTAGVLLDEMREKGLNALKYKVIILDEVHERSVESDLVLVCIKQFMLKSNDLRVVLMSATADISRYRDYFKDLGRGERVEVLAIPSSGQRTVFQQRVLYLEQVNDLLGMRTTSSESLSITYCSGPSPLMAEADLKPEVHKLINNLVMHIHENEPDLEKSILIFLPTYYALEQQWHLLWPFSSLFKVYILHSSIDTEQALMTMRIWKSHRKVILATNIAESSVTIPQLGFVIDSCRSLQVYWDRNRKSDTSRLIWVSKSQAEQRRGRTGRTCDGQVYRLVTGPFYSQLQDYEDPSILKLSLRLQVLLICCAESKAINDPKVLMQKAMDPPDPEVIEDALSFLVHVQALLKMVPRGRYEPSFYGRLLASFSLSLDASMVILKFGDIGMLRQGILLGVLMDTQPLPILRPFGQEILFATYTDNYYKGDKTNSVALAGKKEFVYMANLCAFQFWQRVFKDKFRLEKLKQLLKPNELRLSKSLLPKIEEEWCSFHNLVPSSLNRVSEIYEDIINTVHRFRPKSLVTSNGFPSYYDPCEFQHTCLLNCVQSGDVHEGSDENPESSAETMKCVAVPFVGSGHFQCNDVAEKFSSVIKEIRVKGTEDISVNQHQPLNNYGNHVYGEASLCRFFVNGMCNRGDQCLYSHSHQAKRPACKYFFSFKGCRNGESCFFAHDLDPSVSSISFPSLCTEEDDQADATELLGLFPTSADECILIIDDTDLHFSSNFARYCDPLKIISTTPLADVSVFDPSLKGVRIIWNLHELYKTIISLTGPEAIPWDKVKCVLWFPKLGTYGENVDAQKLLVKNFFEYLAIRALGDSLFKLHLIVTMSNIRFSLLQIEKVARDSFFFLTKSFPFDESSFGEVSDRLTAKKPLVASRAITYIFDLIPPCDLQFGHYTTELNKLVHQS